MSRKCVLPEEVSPRTRRKVVGEGEEEISREKRKPILVNRSLLRFTSEVFFLFLIGLSFLWNPLSISFSTWIHTKTFAKLFIMYFFQ